MSLMFFQSVPHEVFYPRRASRVSCHCGRPDVYGPYRVPSVYSFRRPQPRPHYQVPLFAHILSNLLKERQSENEDKSHKKEEKGSTPSGQKEVVKPELFETKVNVKGFNPDEISVKIKDDRYVEVLARHEEKSEDRHTYREFKKFVQLPEGVDPQQVTPVLSIDGVLTVKGPMSLTKEQSITQDTEVEMKPETADIRGDTKEESEGQANVSLEPTVSASEEVIHMVEAEANDEHKVDDIANDKGKPAPGSIQMDEAEEPEVTRSTTPFSEAQKDEDIMETNQAEGVQNNSKQNTEGSQSESEDTSECKELEGEKLQSKTVKIDIIHE